MATYVCLYHDQNRGGFYIKAFLASNRKVAGKRGKEWNELENHRNVWKYAGCSTETQFVTIMRKRLEDGGTRAVFGMQSSPVSEDDQESLYRWYEYRSWERDVRKPSKRMRAVVERACKAIIQKAKNGRPVLVFGVPTRY
jgi:hypothetical protein